MSTKSLLVLLVSFFISFSSQTNAQENFTFIIFIDGKLATEVVVILSYQDSLDRKQDLKLDYSIGKLTVPQDKEEQFKELLKSKDIELHVVHHRFKKWKQTGTFDYMLEIRSNWLYKGYFIVMINNTNKRRRKYEFDIATQGPSSAQKEKYRMIESLY